MTSGPTASPLHEPSTDATTPRTWELVATVWS